MGPATFSAPSDRRSRKELGADLFERGRHGITLAWDTVSNVDGSLVPARDHSIPASSKNYRDSTNLQTVIDGRLLVAIGLPLPGSRNDCRAFTESGLDLACCEVPTIAQDGYQGTGRSSPTLRRRRGQTHLSAQHEADNAVQRRARARSKAPCPG